MVERTFTLIASIALILLLSNYSIADTYIEDEKLRKKIPRGFSTYDEFSRFQYWAFIDRQAALAPPLTAKQVMDAAGRFTANDFAASYNVNNTFTPILNPMALPNPVLDGDSIAQHLVDKLHKPNQRHKTGSPADFMYRTNCYMFACNQVLFSEQYGMFSDSRSPETFKAFMAEQFITYSTTQEGTINPKAITVENFINAALVDGLSAYPIENGYPIYFVLDIRRGFEDFHLYRQDSNGYWSHKPGITAVKDVDGSNNLIANPLAINHRYETLWKGRTDISDYTKQGIFLWVPHALTSGGQTNTQYGFEAYPLQEFSLGHDEL